MLRLKSIEKEEEEEEEEEEGTRPHSFRTSPPSPDSRRRVAFVATRPPPPADGDRRGGAPTRRRARPRPPAAGWRRSNRRTPTFAEMGAVREQVLHQLGRRTELGRAKAPRRCGAASPRAFSSTGGARHKRPRGLARRSEGLSYDTRRPLRRLVGRGPQPDRHDRGPKCSCARPPRLPLDEEPRAG